MSNQISANLLDAIVDGLAPTLKELHDRIGRLEQRLLQLEGADVTEAFVSALRKEATDANV
jgi:Mg2+ and Co2+ transporter CorA